MLRLLIRSLAKEFYQQHAGFFLIGFYVLFGIVEPSQLIGYQKALLFAGISSPIGMAIVFLSWMLYAVKVHLFITQKLALPEYNFIHEMAALDKKIQLKVWLNVYLVVLLPIMIYVFALIGLSVYHNFPISLISILLVFPAMAYGLSFLSYRSIGFGFLKNEKYQTGLFTKFKSPFYSWPLHYLLNEQPVMLLMCKVLSLVFFKGMLWMFADVGNDTRVFLVALLASVLCHAVLVLTLLKFEITYLNFSKSLPIATYKRLLRWLSTFAIILLPEWVLLMISSAYNFYSTINGMLFGLAGLFYLLTVLYIIKLNMDIYLRWLLLFFFISMWSILAHYYLLLSLVLLGSCTLYYLKNFNKTDLTVSETDFYK